MIHVTIIVGKILSYVNVMTEIPPNEPFLHSLGLLPLLLNLDFADVECRRTKLGTEYFGILNITRSGRECQRWDAQYPHRHVYNVTDTFPDGTATDAGNYCRNPDGWQHGIWCYTTDPVMRWETCLVPMCSKFILRVTLSRITENRRC